MKFNKKNIGVMILTLFITSCSNGHVNNDWDCPKQTGYGCVNVEKADAIALKMLILKSKLNSQIVQQPVINSGDLDIWFAPCMNKVDRSYDDNIFRHPIGE